MRVSSYPIMVCLLATSVLLVPRLQADDFITLASTTSTENSGFFQAILPQFEQATGIQVRAIAVGTGQALTLARRGDVDALLVHDTAGELALLADGHASQRADVMYNDFVIIGPVSDPAGVADAQGAPQALSRIAESQAVFASRGDDSGTHRAEQRYWREAGHAPEGSWYRQLGSGMGPTLNTAAAMNAYALTDRATWLAFDNRQDLSLLFEGDPILFNQYGSLLMSERRHPHLKHALARQWHQWLLSRQGQEAIGQVSIDGEPLFFPNADLSAQDVR